MCLPPALSARWGMTGRNVPKMGKKGRKLRVCGVASYGAKCSCFGPWLQGVASKLPFIALLQSIKTPSSKDCCSFTPCCKGKLVVCVLEASVISSLILGMFLRSWFSEAF